MLLLFDFPPWQHGVCAHIPQTVTDHTTSEPASTYLMKPVSEVITSPGTTRSFRSNAETDSDTGFRIVGNLMSAAMLLLLLLLLLFLVVGKQLHAFYRHLQYESECCVYLTLVLKQFNKVSASGGVCAHTKHIYTSTNIFAIQIFVSYMYLQLYVLTCSIILVT